MKYRITLEGKTYEIEVERGEAMVTDEFEALASSVFPSVKTGLQTKKDTQGTIPKDISKTEKPVKTVAASPAVISTPNSRETYVNAPLPGNVLVINVKVGDNVKKGDILLIIEAMKMENEVVAFADGVVKQVLVQKGQVVSTGDTLVVY